MWNVMIHKTYFVSSFQFTIEYIEYIASNASEEKQPPASDGEKL